MIAVLGAGAMGAALATVLARAGRPVTLLGTAFDAAAIEACRSDRPHPALGVVLPSGIDARPHEAWRDALPAAERIIVAVSSDGLADTVAEAAAVAPAGAAWTVATKGWDETTLRTPSEVVASAAGRDPVVLAGPALAPELVAGAPTAMVCAARHVGDANGLASVLRSAGIEVAVTDDVAGTEVGAAYKNVTAIAVGMCEGMAERLPESVYVHRFADARAAVFALGLRDMCRLALPRGGRAETIVGLAGAGDLYVTCLGGRNGSFGRLLGSGQSPEQALATIGSTVEGAANTRAALAVGERSGATLDVAEAVDAVLSERLDPEAAILQVLRSASGHPIT